MSRSRSAVLFLTLFFLLCGVLAAAGDDGHWLVSPEKLKKADMKIVWQSQMPLRKGEQISRLFVLNGRVYALSDRNYFVCLGANEGEFRFSRQVAEQGTPVSDFELYDSSILAIIGGNRLVEMDADLGIEQKKTQIKCVATEKPVRNKSFYYMACADNRLHILRASDKVQLFEASAASETAITSVLANGSFAIFGTRGGDVISIAFDKPVRKWQFNAEDSVAGQIARDGGYLYFASEDTNLYKLNIRSGRLVWKKQMNALLIDGPVVMPNLVYQPVMTQGLAAIDKKSGDIVWQMPKGIATLCEFGKKSYVMQADRMLSVYDNDKKKELYSVDFSEVDIWAVNQLNSRIYVGDDTGRVTCIEPTR